MGRKTDTELDTEQRLHRILKGRASRIDKHKKTIYNLAAGYKKHAALDDVFDETEFRCYYDTKTKRR